MDLSSVNKHTPRDLHISSFLFVLRWHEDWMGHSAVGSTTGLSDERLELK